MTEAEWLACEEPEAMLESLKDSGSDRKFRLIAAGCSSVFGEAEANGIDRRLRDIMLGVADRSLTTTEVGRLQDDCRSWIAARVANVNPSTALGHVVSEVRNMINLAGGEHAYFLAFWVFFKLTNGATEDQLSLLVRLVRDIFGNPFRLAVFDPSWRTPTTAAIAQEMYDTHDFSAMPILADALQDAGCDSADILGHCRGPGPHVRGCWVVDLVLGKG